MFSPLEQFLVLPAGTLVLPWVGPNEWLFLGSNFLVQLGLIFSVLLLMVPFFLRRDIALYTTGRLLVLSFVNFLSGLFIENFPRKGFQFFPYIFFLMFFLLSANMFGMIPWSFALTSQLAVTFMLSFVTFAVAVVLGFQTHGWFFFSLFLPQGVPFILTPFIIVVEVISYFARLFSLAIRLFANIMSGHTLMKILAAFCWVLCLNVSLLALLPFSIIVLVTGLELVIAFLQAYVFVTLTVIYWNEAVFLH